MHNTAQGAGPTSSKMVNPALEIAPALHGPAVMDDLHSAPDMELALLYLKDLQSALTRHPDLLPLESLTALAAAIPATSALRHEVFTACDIKQGAHELQTAYATAGVSLKLGHALKITSQMYGFRTWNAALATLGKNEDIQIPDQINFAVDRLSFCSPKVLHRAYEKAIVTALISQHPAHALPTDRVLSIFGEGPNGFGSQTDSSRPFHEIYFDMEDRSYPYTGFRVDPDLAIFDRPDLDRHPKLMKLIEDMVFCRYLIIIATDRPEDYAIKCP